MFQTYLDKRSSCKEILRKDGSLFNPPQKIYELAIEMFNVKIALASEKVKYVFFRNQMKNTIIFGTKVVPDDLS